MSLAGFRSVYLVPASMPHHHQYVKPAMQRSPKPALSLQHSTGLLLSKRVSSKSASLFASSSIAAAQLRVRLDTIVSWCASIEHFESVSNTSGHKRYHLGHLGPCVPGTRRHFRCHCMISIFPIFQHCRSVPASFHHAVTVASSKASSTETLPFCLISFPLHKSCYGSLPTTTRCASMLSIPWKSSRS